MAKNSLTVPFPTTMVLTLVGPKGPHHRDAELFQNDNAVPPDSVLNREECLDSFLGGEMPGSLETEA